MANYILVMDQGTTGSRGVVYDEKGKTVAIDYEEYEQFFPNSGWWEQSGKTVWEVTLRTSRNAIKKAGLTGKDIAAIGIANQRETTTIWDKATHPASFYVATFQRKPWIMTELRICSASSRRYSMNQHL